MFLRCWLGHLACKNRPRKDLQCVEWDVQTQLVNKNEKTVEVCKASCFKIMLNQWFLTWGPGTPWGSKTPILGVPNANLEYQQISPNISNMKSIRY